MKQTSLKLVILTLRKSFRRCHDRQRRKAMYLSFWDIDRVFALAEEVF